MGIDYFGEKKNHRIYQIIFCWVVSFACFGYPIIFRNLKYNWKRFVYEHLHNTHMKFERKLFVF